MIETEIKLPVKDVQAVRRLLRRLGWRASTRRRLETNLVFDRADRSLWRSGHLLRVRQRGTRCRLTVKRPAPSVTRYKVREEFEIETTDAVSLIRILEALDYRVAWRYEKYRTEYARRGQRGEILLDETPIGDYLELEGEASWIDRTAQRLGYTQADYINVSYRKLFVDYARKNKGVGDDMVFGAKRPRSAKRGTR